MVRRRRTPLLALLGAGGLLLTGCSGLTPGTAAVVDGNRITSAEVDRFAAAQCGAFEQAAQQGQSQSVPLASVKQQSLQLLIDSELDRAFAASEGVRPSAALTRFARAQVLQQIGQVRGEPKRVLEDVLGQFAEGQAAVVQAGAEATGTQVTPQNVGQLLDAGNERRDRFAKQAGIETDARYSPDADGRPGAGSGSVSAPSSEFAKLGSAQRADPAYVASLPPSQKCG